MKIMYIIMYIIIIMSIYYAYITISIIFYINIDDILDNNNTE